MNLALDVFNYILVAILIGVSGAWSIFIKSMWLSFRDSPYLDKFQSKKHTQPKVSVIVPARNEEDFIEKCLDSLVQQDYENYEIVAVDDCSEDATGQIIRKISKQNSNVVHVLASLKPDGWIGKNWACFEGFKKAAGDLLLFTDSDTKHSEKLISLSVSHMLSNGLDALTVVPKIICIDNWTKITLPMLSTFLHTRFSPLRVNDPSKKTGYFFGSFYIISRDVYEAVGTHEGIKGELVEDGALGKKVKESGYRLRMVRGEHLLEAVWARDKSTLWNALKRLIIPLYLQSGKVAVAIFFALLFLFLMPFPILAYSSVFVNSTDSFSVLFAITVIAVVLLYTAIILQAKKGLGLGLHHALLGPVGSFIIILGFASGILQATSDSAVSWRGRNYSMVHKFQNSISV
ncbi:MAG: glycosyltransferase [Nitrosopumilaceae archaeon]